MKQYSLDADTRQAIAKQLYTAEEEHTPIPVLTARYPQITLDDAYDIQKTGLGLRLAAGAAVVGRKIGITSRGMMKQLQCDSPDYGYLLDKTLVLEGQSCLRSELNVPILEGELAFIIGEDIQGLGLTTAHILNAVSWVVPCFEVCDARYTSWKGVTVRDTISDNAGASRFMLGSCPRRVNEVNLKCVGMVMERNGVFMDSAAGAEVMGSPLNSMLWLANKLAEYGDGLRKGDVVLSGAFMSAISCEQGDSFCLNVDGFPPLTIHFE